MSVPEDLEVADTPEGLRVTVRGPWRSEFTVYLRAQRLAALELNQAKGWHGTDVDFLSAFPHLGTLEIVDFHIRDIEGIHALHGLRSLTLLTHSKSEIRFGEFPHLASCDIEWGKRRVDSLSACSSLRHLGIGHFPEHDLGAFVRLAGLESLWITVSPVASLSGIGRMRRLRELHLRGLRNLMTLDGIEALTLLEGLEVHTCRKVESILPVTPLVRLRRLHLNNGGKIASLHPLVGHDALEEVVFYESTNIVDGDLSPLAALPRLRLLAFQNRRHYSHRREQFKAFTEARHA